MHWETFAQILYDFRIHLQIPGCSFLHAKPPQTLQQPHLRPGDWPLLHLKGFQVRWQPAKLLRRQMFEPRPES